MLIDLLVEHLFLFKSIVIWSSLVTAAFCYGLLIDMCFLQNKNKKWYERSRYWSKSITAMLAALPLLGLLGTISGLMSTFTRMSLNSGFSQQELVSGGIAEAMFTTQLGLIFVVPGMLMMAYLSKKQSSWRLENEYEIKD